MKFRVFLPLAVLIAMLLIVGACSQNEQTADSNSSGGQSQQSSDGGNDVQKTSSNDDKQEQAEQQAEVNPFEGKTIKFIVPYGPGGGYDTYARLLSKYMEKYTGADSVVVENVEGGGGLLGVNELYNAKPDGLTIGILNGYVDINSQIGGVGGVQFDMSKFSYLGRLINSRRVMYVSPEAAGDMSITDLIDSGKELRMSVTQPGSSTYIDAYMSSKALGLNYKYLFGASGSSENMRLFLAGDVDAGWSSWDPQMKDMVDNGEGVIMLQSGSDRHPDLQDVPTIYEVADEIGADQSVVDIIDALTALHESGRIIAAPPEMPSDILEKLREALESSLDDPEFKAATEKAEAPINFVPGEEIGGIIKKAFNIPDAAKQTLIKAIKGD